MQNDIQKRNGNSTKYEDIAKRGGSIQKKKEDSICELISKSAGVFQEKFPIEHLRKDFVLGTVVGA